MNNVRHPPKHCSLLSSARQMNSPSSFSPMGPVETDRCPHCQSEVKAETQLMFGEKNCPQCGKHLWFLTAAHAARFFDYESSTELRERAIEMMAQRFDLDPKELANDPNLIQELETDSLEALELLMDLEEDLGLV